MKILQQIGEFMGNEFTKLFTKIQKILEDYLTKTGDSKDNYVSFNESTARENIESGETHATLFGKIKKWFSDLGLLAFKDKVESLHFVFENGEPLTYDGSAVQTIFIPGNAGSAKVLLKGLNVHGYWEAEAHNHFAMSAQLIGIPVDDNLTIILQQIEWQGGKWEVYREWMLENNEYFFNSVILGDKGYYRFLVYHLDPATMAPRELCSNIGYLHVIEKDKKDLTPVDPVRFAEGYYLQKLSDGTFSFDVVFKMYGFTAAATAKMSKWINEAWSEMNTGASIENNYVYTYGDEAGKYKVTVTEGEEEVSKEFRVLISQQEVCECCKVYIVTEYPEDLSAYPEGTTFIKQ